MCLSSHLPAVALSWELSTCPEGYKQGGSSATNIKKKKKKKAVCFSLLFLVPQDSFKASYENPLVLSTPAALRGLQDRRFGELCPGGQCAPPSCLPSDLVQIPGEGQAEVGGSPDSGVTSRRSSVPLDQSSRAVVPAVHG